MSALVPVVDDAEAVVAVLDPLAAEVVVEVVPEAALLAAVCAFCKAVRAETVMLAVPCPRL